jgi:hypothetical protein
MTNRKLFFGVLLILAGILIGLKEMDILPQINFLFILAGGFLAAYFLNRKRPGFLITGCILAAVATHSTLDDMISGFPGSSFFILLGLAFLAVFLIHTISQKAESGSTYIWPLYPGLALCLFGLFILVLEEDLIEFTPALTEILLPILLIGVGLLIVIRNIWKGFLRR